MSARCLICGYSTDSSSFPFCQCPEPAVVIEQDETLFPLVDIDIPKPGPYDEDDS